MFRPLTVSLSAFILSLAIVAAACGGGSGESSPTATATMTSPTPQADNTPDEKDPLYAPDVVEELTPSVVHILSEAATLDVFGQVTPTRGGGYWFHHR